MSEELTLDQKYWLDRRAAIIEALAAEGLEIFSNKDSVWLRRTSDWTPEMVRAAVLSGAEEARQQERKRCALICRHYAKRHAKDDDESKAQAWMMLQCAAAIEKEDPQPQPENT